MVQAARSGKQNILETSQANGTSKEMEIKNADPAICAHVIAGLIQVTNHLLDQQLGRLEQDFLNEGGLRERMTRARLATRTKQQPQTLK
jgi:four helix bundle suffix protein